MDNDRGEFMEGGEVRGEGTSETRWKDWYAVVGKAGS